MNEIVNKVLIAVGKFIPEIRLRQPEFTYSSCGLCTKNKEGIQKFKETGDSRYIYRHELYKACFQNNMAYGDLKNYQKKRFLIKQDVVKHLMLLKI